MENIKDKNKRHLVIMFDSLAILASVSVAYLLRYDFNISSGTFFALSALLIIFLAFVSKLTLQPVSAKREDALIHAINSLRAISGVISSIFEIDLMFYIV